MKINSFDLPCLFVDMISVGALKREVGSWNLKNNIDSHGNHLDAELSDVFDAIESIVKATNELPLGFKADGCYGELVNNLQGPGAIPDIIDFSQVICFAMSGDGSPFCLDYRESINSPSVIWWDNLYWRRVAPDFSSFIGLFNLHPN